jgi:hypothetical protein
VTPPRTLAAPLDLIEAIDGHEPTADIVLRIARLARTGRLDAFVRAVLADRELDEATRTWALDLTADESLLLAAELYLEHARQLN